MSTENIAMFSGIFLTLQYRGIFKYDILPMKRNFSFIIPLCCTIGLLFISSKSNKPERLSIFPAKEKMVLIPAADYHGTDYNGTPKLFALGAFYMDACEVTNREYAVFVEAMRDSLLRRHSDKTFIVDSEVYYLVPHLTMGKDDGLTEEQRKEAHARGYFPQPRTIVVYDTVYIYPNDAPMRSHVNDNVYFGSRKYRHYPVVGVSKRQAEAYCHWRTQVTFQKNPELQRIITPFRLPTEAEFEYASGAGYSLLYGTYNGKLFAKKKRTANFHEDGFLALPEKTARFKRNVMGLFDMCGNVAEWTSSPMEYQNHTFVTKGGAFLDPPEKVTVKHRVGYSENEQLPFIGFRCVCSVI